MLPGSLDLRRLARLVGNRTAVTEPQPAAALQRGAQRYRQPALARLAGRDRTRPGSTPRPAARVWLAGPAQSAARAEPRPWPAPRPRQGTQPLLNRHSSKPISFSTKNGNGAAPTAFLPARARPITPCCYPAANSARQRPRAAQQTACRRGAFRADPDRQAAAPVHLGEPVLVGGYRSPMKTGTRPAERRLGHERGDRTVPCRGEPASAPGPFCHRSGGAARPPAVASSRQPPEPRPPFRAPGGSGRRASYPCPRAARRVRFLPAGAARGAACQGRRGLPVVRRPPRLSRMRPATSRRSAPCTPAAAPRQGRR